MAADRKTVILSPNMLKLFDILLDCALGATQHGSEWWEKNKARRLNETTTVRNLVFYFALEHFHIKLQYVAAYTNKNHATVSANTKRFREWLLIDTKAQILRDRMERLLKLRESELHGLIDPEAYSLWRQTISESEPEDDKQFKGVSLVMRFPFMLGSEFIGYCWCEVKNPNDTEYRELTEKKARELIEKKGLTKVDPKECRGRGKFPQGAEVYDTPDRDFLFAYHDYFKRVDFLNQYSQ